MLHRLKRLWERRTWHVNFSIRWGVIFEPICKRRDHDWEQYFVIHVAWTPPGRYCTRCGRSERYTLQDRLGLDWEEKEININDERS